jgi:fucose 4-O-acetylase-like acetyltransferase
MVRKFLELNGLAVLGVLLFHAAGWGFVAMFSWAHRYQSAVPLLETPMGTLSYFVLRAIEQFVVFCIPAFLFVTGYFIAVTTGRNRSSLGWNFVGTRLTKLLIPYLLWSGVALVFLYLQGRTFSALELLNMLATGRIYEVYYYVPLLCQMYLLAPFLVSAAKTRWLSLLVLTGCIQLCVQLLYYPALSQAESSGLPWAWWLASTVGS